MRKYQTMRAKIVELTRAPDECETAVGASDVSRPGLYPDKEYYYDEDCGDFAYDAAESEQGETND